MTENLMNDRVRVETDGHVARVTLARPDKRNAVDMDMFRALVGAAAAIRDMKGLRAVVLTADGPDFCAGIDVSVFGGSGIQDDGPDIGRPLEGTAANIVQQVAVQWRDLPVPVIAALRGAAFGAGCQIAMGADVRFAAPDTRLSIMEIRWGLIPDMGITNTMRHVVRQDIVRELTYSGRIVEAPEAQIIGLVTRICEDPLSAACNFAAEIAGRSPDAIRRAKRLINESWDDDLDSSLRREAKLQAEVLAGANQREAALAVREGREPRFEDPD